MRRAGEVVGVAQGVAVLRSPDDTYPELGTTVLEEDLTAVGRVVDVFGPTDRPYLAVTPEEDVRLPTLLGAVLYSR